MAADELRPARRADGGFLRHITIAPRPRIGLHTTRPIDEELFAALAYLADVPAAGKQFIAARAKAPANVDLAFELFRAFVRQAKTFWLAAKELHPRAGPLNYYYSFLNLAKAYIALDSPEIVGMRIQHGLTCGDLPDEFADHAVRVVDGVFPQLYTRVTGVVLPNALLINVLTALGYASDITYELQHAQLGETKLMCGMGRIAVSNNRMFAVLALRNYDVLHAFPVTTALLNASFEQVRMSNQAARALFDVYGEHVRHYAFLETGKDYDFAEQLDLRPMLADCYDVLKPLYSSYAFHADETEFMLAPPLQEHPIVPMSEILAIYVVMFYLSHLVRYFPARLEAMLESKEAWVIERFALGAPETFLRQMVNLILGEDRIYRTR